MVPDNPGLFGAPENLNEYNMNAKCLKEFEKSEKRRLKEENTRLRKLQEKEKEQEKKLKRKLKQNSKGFPDTESQFEKLMISDKVEIPIFLIKCIEYIEKEGLDSEGIYRVPGSRAHVDLLFQKFEEGIRRSNKLNDQFNYQLFCSFLFTQIPIQLLNFWIYP